MDTTNFAEAIAEVTADTTTASNTSVTIPSTTNTSYTTTTAPSNGATFLTVEDIEKAREQEKQKLYPQMERLKAEVESLRKEREEREAEEARLREAAEAESKRRAEEEMDVRELLKQKEMEWTSQLEQERLERERAIALLDQERQFQELQAYRAQRVEAERENIIPELVDLIDGGTPDEIEASISSLKERSARILDSATQAMQSTRRDMVGTRTTAPAAGPLDTNSERQFSPEDIKNMSLSEYQKYRSRLLGDSASSRGRGLFG